MGDFVQDLIEVFQGTVLSKDEFLKIVEERWPESTQVADAITWLRHHFPLGMLSKQIVELPGAPFHPITLRRAALVLNRRRREDANVVAFPRITKSDGKAY